jgi:hypothetical protein
MMFPWFDKNIILRAFAFLNPGGWLELQDAVLPPRSDDGTLDGTNLEHWAKLLVSKATEKGKDWTCASKYKRLLIEAGFVDVCEVHYEWPTNTWPLQAESRKRGLYCKANLLDGVNAISMRLLAACGMSTAEVEGILVDVRKDVENREIHAYIPMQVDRLKPL